MTIATPTINDFDKEEIAPWSGSRLIDLSMATLPSKPFSRFFPWNKNALNLGYQKLRPRYEPMDETTQVACEPLCPEGWYFDCETETCKEYRFYSAVVTYKSSVLLKYETTTFLSGGGYKVDIIECEITCPYSLSNFFQPLTSDSNLLRAVTGGGVHYPSYRIVEVRSDCNLPSKDVYLNLGLGDLLYDGEANVTTTVIGTPSYTGECEHLGSNVGLIKVKLNYDLKVYGVK